MSVTQTQRAVGQWSVRLKGNIPERILEQLSYFGHIAVIPGPINVTEYGDNLLAADVARYVGVYRTKSANVDGITIGGVGLESWLGDEDSTGDVFETPVVLTGASFVAAITALLPAGGAITAGTLHAIAGTYTGTHQWVTPRAAIDYVTQLFGATWRVNNNGTLDAGLESDLYVTTPQAILVAKDDTPDLRYVSLPGSATMDRDVADFTTRVVVLAEGEGDSITTGSADNAVIPYNDIHGNPVVVTRLVSESDTTAANADARAEVILNQFSGERPRVSLSTSQFDMRGDVAVGDYIYVYAPANGFEDFANEENWQGEIINPVKLQCIELSWPIVQGWTVGFRDVDGVWIDLSPWVAFEGGETNIVVGQLPRSLTSFTPPGDRPNLPEAGADSTIPDAPDWVASSQGTYQSEETNTTKAAIWLQWTVPLNTDTSVITDGDRYEVRFRVSVPIGYKIRWGTLEAYRWGELEVARWGAPLTAPVAATPEWQTVLVGFDSNTFTLTELTAGVAYELQVRAWDVNGNFSAWSDSLNVTTTGDNVAPSTPAAPTVAASKIAVQVTHELGKNSGGTFNLELDLDHLNVHVGGSASFYPDEGNLAGRLAANPGMILAGIPAVGTFKIDNLEQIYVKVVAVDRAGNKSSASPGVTATAELIDDAHISDLTVSKVTAGTITADWLLSAVIRTALVGARAELSSDGLSLFNSSNQETVALDSATANVHLLEGLVQVTDPDGNVIIELGKYSE